MKTGVIVSIVVLVAIVIGIVALVQNRESTVPGEQETVIPDAPPPLDRPARQLSVPVLVTKQFFEPKEFNVRVGDEITLQLKSADVEHLVAIPAFSLQRTVAVGVDQTVTFKAVSKGDVEVLCLDGCDSGVQLLIRAS